MSDDGKLTFDSGMQQVLRLQAVGGLVLGAGVALVTTLLNWPTGFELGLSRGFAFIFGAGLGVFTTAITARVVIKSARSAAEAAGVDSLVPVYVGLAWKLLAVAGGAFVGMVYFDLRPLFLILGYIIVQAGYVSGAISVRRKRRRNRRRNAHRRR